MAETSLEGQKFIEQLVASGRFTSRQAVIEEAFRLLRDELQKNSPDEPPHLSTEDWCEEFESWASSHRALPHEADNCRESIY